MSASNKLMSLIKTRTGTRGKILYKEDELERMFREAKVSTKTDMIMVLHDKGHSANDIAVTLREYGVLTKTSAAQMVRNSIDRVTAKRAQTRKTA